MFRLPIQLLLLLLLSALSVTSICAWVTSTTHLIIEIMIPRLVLLFSLPLDLLLVDAFATDKPLSSPYLQTVTGWLDEEKITWQLLSEEDTTDTTLFPTKITDHPILQVKSSSNRNCYYLHILKSPNAIHECIIPTSTRDMTNYIQYINTQQQNTTSKISLIHLHEDVWNAKRNIVQNRLRVRLVGPSKSSRIYARYFFITLLSFI